MVADWRKKLSVLLLFITIVVLIPVVLLLLWLSYPRSAVILLQNHHELRATGGFLGSVVLATGSLKEPLRWRTYDIYSLAGQSTLTNDPPAGFAEYLSGGQRLKLPDVNWWPDVPYTAVHLAPMLVDAGLPQPDVIVFLNTQTVQALLSVVGPLTVPDYHTELTPDNLFTTISEARGEFFPGSSAKANVLQHLTTQLIHRVQTHSWGTSTELWQAVLSQRNNHNLSIWSPLPWLQKICQILKLSGEMTVAEHDTASTLYLNPVESNVSVNKANAGITRHYRLASVDETTSSLDITWTNTNPLDPQAQPELVRLPGAVGADHTHYANYFRLYTLAGTSVTQASSSASPELIQNHTTFTTQGGQTFNEFGILVPVLAQSTTHLQLIITHPPREHFKEIRLIRQPGLTTATAEISWIHATLPSTVLISDLIWYPGVQ